MEGYEIFYPEENVQRIFTLESPGREPVSVSIVIPSVTTPDEPFDIKTVVLDKNGYPSLMCDETLTLRDGMSGETIPVRFEKGKPAISVIKNVHNNKEGFFRISAELNNSVFFSNPSMTRKNPLYRIFWGDPHVHTLLSDCMVGFSRSVHFACTAGRYLTGLDWMAVTDHVSNGRSSVGKWREGIAVTNLYRVPSEFVILPAYEASLKGGYGGDNNVYCTKYPDIFVDEYEEGSVKTLCEKLQEKTNSQDFDFFVVPHHTSRIVKHGDITGDIYPGADLMPAVEIYSKWGSSEYPKNPQSLLNPEKEIGYVVDHLKKGFTAGFIAGTDSHATMPSGGGIEPPNLPYPPGLTAVYTTALSEKTVFDAIRSRKTYASCKERIFLEVEVNGASSGDVVRSSKTGVRKISIMASAPGSIEKIEVIRNGDVIYSAPVNNWFADIDFTDEEDIESCFLSSKSGQFLFYYVRLSCASGAGAWSSPVWIER
jgi:hypothetical protein